MKNLISFNRIKQYLKSTKYNFERWIVSEMNYSYDAKFEGNILIVGRTECGKTCSEP